MSSFLTEPGALERIFALDMQRRRQRQIGVRRYDSFTFGADGMEPLDEPLKHLPRKTLRYHWINVFRDGEVEIEHVAVRLNRAGGQVAKLVATINPARRTVAMRDMNFCMIAGWHVEWRPKDWRGKSTEPILADGYVDSKWWGQTLRYGGSETFAWHETVNPEALAGSRYKYCQYDATKCGGLVDWLMMYAQDPHVELLAKLGLHSLVTPAGLNVLKDQRVQAFVRAHVAECRRAKPRSVAYAARHNRSVAAADRHFLNAARCADALRAARARWRDRQGRATTFRVDADRVARLLGRWKVTWAEYGTYVDNAIGADMDPRNEGTLYPPTAGGRAAFMARTERLEAEFARAERRRAAADRRKLRMQRLALERMAVERVAEIERFQDSVDRTAALRGCGYTLVLARTQEELRAYGRRMRNCVGNGIYGRGIVTGDTLILEIMGPVESFCVEIRRSNWSVRQCYGRGNSRAPEPIWEIARAVAAACRAEWRRLRRRRAA